MPKMRLGKIMPKVVLLSNTLLVGIKEWQLALRVAVSAAGPLVRASIMAHLRHGAYSAARTAERSGQFGG